MNPIEPVNAVQLGTLIKVVSAIHELPADRLPALKGRFRNFLKMGFPAVRSVGTGSRAEYWPAHVAQVLVAFELVAFRVPQTAAAHCVSAFATEVEAAFGAAARALAKPKPADARTLLLVASKGLLDDAKRPVHGDMSIIVAAGAEEATKQETVLAIDVRRLVERAARAARATDEPFTERFLMSLGRD